MSTTPLTITVTDGLNINEHVLNEKKMALQTTSPVIAANAGNCIPEEIGPMVDNGAPYSAIGYLDLLINSQRLLPT